MDLNDHLRDIPNFPKPGIIFKDITPLLGHAEAFAESIRALSAPYTDSAITAVVGIESRGFIFGAAMARYLNCGFVPIRKPGKLPAHTISRSYDLEYGSDCVEIHADALAAGERIVIVDDVLATGGTLAAAVGLCQDIGADIVGAACLVELAFLRGRSTITCPLHTVITIGE
ncbi:MAG: adenine phosphoribosyltransferase [Planctomycetota bacterium]|nr:MAG: adenine phosphoribosyltransferase [Planctomycetota bacterium]